jgi:mannose-6-phosphate isomerase-like protein (cupin superfamily)
MGAVERSMHQFRLPSGAGTVELCHDSEAVYYVMSGSVMVVDHDAADEREVAEGGMFHVEARTRYSFCSRGEAAVVLGGPCPADPSLYVPHVR